MKKNFFYLFLSASLIYFAGCKEKIVTVEVEKNSNTGGLLFKIDKANAPKNVVLVEAVLSRQDADTIKASLNLLNDISADISLSNVQVGSWFLTVNAYDSLNTVVYTGSTELKVQDGMITQVNLTLVPTSTGFGSITFSSTGEQRLQRFGKIMNEIQFYSLRILVRPNLYQVSKK